MIDPDSFQPLHDRILVKRLPEPLSMLIVAPEVAEKPTHVGQVVARGPGKRSKNGKLVPMDVQVGDIVRFSLNDLEDGDYTLIRQADVFGFVNG